MTSAERGGARIKRGLLWRLFGIANLFRRFCCRIVWFCFWWKQFRLVSSSQLVCLLRRLSYRVTADYGRWGWLRRHLRPLERGCDCGIHSRKGSGQRRRDPK